MSKDLKKLLVGGTIFTFGVLLVVLEQLLFPQLTILIYVAIPMIVYSGLFLLIRAFDYFLPD